MSVVSVAMLALGLIKIVPVIAGLVWVATAKISRHKRSLAIFGLVCIGVAPLLSLVANFMFTRMITSSQWGTYTIFATSFTGLVNCVGLLLLVAAVVAKEKVHNTDEGLGNIPVYTEETGNPYQQPSRS